DDLDFVLEAFDEERADRAVDQARQERLALGRAAFTFEKASGNAAGGEILLLVVHRQREEVLPGLCFLRIDDRREQRGFAPRGVDGAVSLAREAAGFERERAPGPVEGYGFNVEHTSNSRRASPCLHAAYMRSGVPLRELPPARMAGGS